MIFFYRVFIIIVILLYGCAVRQPEIELQKVVKKEIDAELRQKIRHILKRVEKIAEKSALDYLGQNTMNESVEIMDLGAAVAPILAEILKQSSNWKFRFWIVDIMGYVNSRDNIIPLVEIIEDITEKEEVRLRACESLKGLKFQQAVEHLLISRDLVTNRKIKKKIGEVINDLR